MMELVVPGRWFPPERVRGRPLAGTSARVGRLPASPTSYASAQRQGGRRQNGLVESGAARLSFLLLP